MDESTQEIKPLLAPKENRLSKIIGVDNLFSLVAIVILVWLVFIFLNGNMYRFYASALFLFYALTKKMWISVMMLGVFQTLVLVPLRIIRLRRQESIKEFQKKVEQIPEESLRVKKVKQSYKMGNKTFLFYVVDFMVQLLTFLIIGRLFLTDFYATKLDPAKLFSFVPYPQYPIRDTWFKIPYVVVTKTINLGWRWVIIAWLVVIALYVLFLIVRRVSNIVATRKTTNKLAKTDNQSPKVVSKYSGGSIIIIMLILWLLFTHVPVGFAFRIFSGNVAVPNVTLNTITALSTFGMVLYFGVVRIVREGRLALAKGISKKIVDQTQKKMLKETFSTALFVGLGAFFITNQIPSAFELSVFTLEVISLLSPLTLDKLILQSKKIS